jgi:hypothetical protein
MTGGPTRQDTHRITVSVVNQATGKMVKYGIWDKWDGGGVDSDSSNYYPGGMAPPVALGGRTTTDNVTISRLYRLERDHQHIQEWVNAAGKSAAILTRQPLDINGNVFGKPQVYNAVLKKVTPPPLDSTQSGAAIVELEFVVTGTPSVT